MERAVSPYCGSSDGRRHSLLYASPVLYVGAVRERVFGEIFRDAGVRLRGENVLVLPHVGFAEVVVRLGEKRIARGQIGRQLFESRDRVIPFVLLQLTERGVVQRLVRRELEWTENPCGDSRRPGLRPGRR